MVKKAIKSKKAIKTTKAKKSTKKTCECMDCEDVIEKLKNVSDDVVTKINWLKKKYDKADPKTKNKIAVGIGVAAAGLAALAGVGKKKRKK